MNLGFFPSANDPEKNQIQILKSFANQIEHKFQIRRAYDIKPEFLDQILANLHTLGKLTTKHTILNKISNLEDRINATILYYLNDKYEEYSKRLKAIRDELYDLDE
jgi:hypothetical protein